jgi:uncharacterized protein YndB with AHSA1/START domain
MVQVKTKFKIKKPTRDVFEALVDPNKMANYWFSSGSARVEQGKIITWRYDEYNAEVAIKVLEVEDNQKIVFSWGPEQEGTVVTMTITESDRSSTIIEVTESGFKEDDPNLLERMVDQKGGWVYMLVGLKAYLENDVNTLRAALIH